MGRGREGLVGRALGVRKREGEVLLGGVVVVGLLGGGAVLGVLLSVVVCICSVFCCFGGKRGWGWWRERCERCERGWGEGVGEGLCFPPSPNSVFLVREGGAVPPFYLSPSSFCISSVRIEVD